MNRYCNLALCWFAILCTPLFANDDVSFADKIRANGIVSERESILLSSNVYFYPNKKGYGLFSGGKKRSKGHIVFTENGYTVVVWNRRDKQYEVLHQETYSDLASVDISGNSPMLRLVTETASTGKYNSFEIMDGRNAISPNVIKTEEAHKLVTAGIKGLDVKGAASAPDMPTVEIADQKRRMKELEERIARLEQDESVKAASPADTECDCKCPPN